MTCAYCLKERKTTTGWHDCAQAQLNKKRIDTVIAEIEENMARPGYNVRTNAQLKIRSDRRRDYATQAKLAGVTVKKDYL